MAVFRQDVLNTYIDLTHEETDKLLGGIPAGAGAITGILTAVGVPAFALGIIAACLAGMRHGKSRRSSPVTTEMA